MFLRRFYSRSANLLKRKTCLSQPMHKLTESPSPQANRVTLYLHQAQLIDSIRLSLRSNLTFHVDLLPSPIDSFVATHALRSAPSPDSALSLFHSLSALPNFSHTRNTIHAMAKILASATRLSDLQTLIRGIDSGEFPSAARPAPLDLLRWYAAAGDSKSVAQTWAQMKIDGQKRPCTESYNLIIGLHVNKGENSHAVQVFSQMITDGANPNSRTYTVLIEHLIAAGRMDAAMEVFERLSAMRIRRTSRQYSALAKGFMESGRLDVVAKLITEMRRDGILPGHNLQAVFVQLQATGFVMDTEDFIREFLPDERIGSLGFSIGSSDDDDASDDDGDDRDQDRGQIRLKPWLDPSALASALSNWNPGEVSALESARLVWTSRLVCKLLRAFKRAETAWEFFCWVAYQPGGFTHDVYTVSRMIAILARSGHVDLVDSLLSKIKREGIRLSFSTVRLVVDLYGLSKKADAALRVFRELELICGAVSKSDRRLLYSSLLRTFIKCKRSSVAMDLVEEMVLSGLIPDIQMYSGLMQHFALQGDLRTVQQLFGMVRQSELEPDAFMYQILIRAYCKRERAALALRIFEDMRGADLWPNAATKALLVKSLWKEGKLREAAAVEEKGEEVRDLLPVALPGHVWTVSSADLWHVYNIYSSSFATNDQSYGSI
eukprot:TRINITY_DN5722_c0_g1_i4.p1 TRINITY_DN5722_c0_g1~~TRINITY_DN5722_c0_g1_i4.p1  ORF type:complete len:662 (-),score=136.43 TRINITY_DN5722_c0_g1_i4:110-2095(-)